MQWNYFPFMKIFIIQFSLHKNLLYFLNRSDKNYFAFELFLLLEKCIPNILIGSFDKSTDFKPQTTSVSPFREPMPAISHFPLLAFKPKN